MAGAESDRIVQQGVVENPLARHRAGDGALGRPLIVVRQ